MNIIAETKRLLLREVLPEDVDGFFELDNDPEVHRFLGNNPITTKKQAEEVIAFIRKQYVENGIGRWAIIDKSTNQFAGWTGLKLVTDTINNHTNFYDLGYRLIKKYWRQGIATESAIASLNYGFESMNINTIYAAAHLENVGSISILNKLGFEYVETYYYDGDLENWYQLNKSDWETKSLA